MKRLDCLLVALFGIFLFLSCRKKDDIYYDPEKFLTFSTDTIKFDTVFTSITSTTQRVKIFNPSKEDAVISNITLAGGNESPYQININGIPLTNLNNFKIRARDSANLFVRLNIPLTEKETPFLVTDSISFTTNGKTQNILLQAFGQNVRFINAPTITTNTIWDNRFPYLIYDSVRVAEGAVLTIREGTKIYFHKGARFSIAGTLKIEGTVNSSVTLASDRKEKLYSEVPGQWNGIYFLKTSSNNFINHATLKNALVGLSVQDGYNDANPRLTLVNSIVKNMEIVGILGSHTSITGFNNLVANCGRHLIYCNNGGNYNFKQNTFANYYSYGIRSTASLFFSDFTDSNLTSNTSLTLVNNIIWGNQPEELAIEEKGQAFVRMIRSNLIKSTNRRLIEATNIFNSDPSFKDVNRNNFYLNTNSVAVNKGENLSSDPFYFNWLQRDQKNNQRLFPSELGCYEIF